MKLVVRYFSYVVLLVLMIFLLLWGGTVIQKVCRTNLSIPEKFNVIEFFLWQIFAVLSAGYAVSKNSMMSMALAFAFMFFGISDLIENQTGAWWTPWWLLLWKGACVVGLAYLIWKIFGKKTL